MAKPRSNPPTAVQKRLAAERAAAARERIAVAQRRRRLWVILSAVGAVVVIVAVFVIVKVATGKNLENGKATVAARTSVTAALAAVPQSVFDSVGKGSADAAPQASSGAALSTSGKPEVLYIGAEFCPYCAAERWPLAVALSRFGTFAHLSETFSSPTDVNPNTPTLSFHGATYTSKYLDFVAREIYSNQLNSAGTYYATLDTMTPQQAALLKKYANDSFPFIDFDGRFTLNSAQYDGSILKGMTQLKIAQTISKPSSTISQAIAGAANVLTARLCQLTSNQPASVCNSSGVTTAAKAISGH